ncbi:site-specific recombinase XerD [Desulfuromonas soudanensis]|uniref:Site-specific recombinase XerD n=1 Tax=Desulfuromonas soudanensis TaxID=1603606 RepID=A0A0M4DHF5_9BACT|nr:site-specific integrase [Desulfuromonas soudanensis]ALC16220.1 site-specific recombinase XerD [Desulfuromonas soudanensis]ALC18158.1 site-specific recombinase XerD [Desulfuromonas soudanensis]ALC18202.1 site-specific recombinase XerD [Desulfuromonas soudanensis]
MELEQAFSCPGTLKKLRSGPLGTLLDGFCTWLMEHGFRQGTIRKHLSNVSHFNQHLGRQGVVPGQILCPKDVDGFFEAYPARCRHRGPLEGHLKRVRHSLSRFVEYLGEQGFFNPLPQSEIFAPLLDAYLEWMQHYQHAAAGTCELRAQYLTVFLRYLGPQATLQGLAKLSPESIEAFFLAYAQKVGKAARRSMQSTLRTFFRFCLHRGYVREPLDLAVPTLRAYKLASVPRGLTEAQARQVLQGIDRKTTVGRRDYAIVQLLHTYGVRGGQVRALRLEQIDWAQNRIFFAASKGGKDSCLPLTVEVGESLLNYLQNARPSSSNPQVFLTSRAPYHPLPRSSSLSVIIERRIRAASIEIPSKGAHAFRHGFATRMLAQGEPFKAIADVLGHRHLGTTFIYTKVDFNALKQVALEWPQEVTR